MIIGPRPPSKTLAVVQGQAVYSHLLPPRSLQLLQGQGQGKGREGYSVQT